MVVTSVMQGLFGASLREIASYPGRPFDGRTSTVLKGLGMRLKLRELYQSRL
jgi:hypothetical protein